MNPENHPIAKLPVVRILPRNGEVEIFVPTFEDPESGLLMTLNSHGVETFRAGSHRAIGHPAPLSHHPDPAIEHKVLWTSKINGGHSIEEWGPYAWQDLAKDAAYLARLEEEISQARDQNPKLRAYAVIGFAPKGQYSETLYTYDRALQSQKPHHTHVVDAFEIPDDIFSRSAVRPLDLTLPRDQALYAFFLNRVGEASIQILDAELGGFGHRFVYHQRVGISREAVVARTMFGFSSLRDALGHWLELSRNVETRWFDHAVAVVQSLRNSNGKDMGMNDFTRYEKQACVPSAFIIFPTEADRNVGGVDNTDPVWVQPFSIAPPPQSTFPERGMISDR